MRSAPRLSWSCGSSPCAVEGVRAFSAPVRSAGVSACVPAFIGFQRGGYQRRRADNDKDAHGLTVPGSAGSDRR